MRKIVTLIICSFFSFSLQASDNPLIGKWKRVAERGMMIVHFEKDQMTMATSEDMKENAQTVKVRYKKLDKSWGVEMLSDTGEMQGAMMAIPQGEDEIKFGAPGAPFFVLKKAD